jgi:excisionase family DNA binding protein
MARTKKNEAPVYTTQQAAAMLACSQVHVYRMIDRGELFAVKVADGERAPWRITRESIDAWLAAKVAERKAELAGVSHAN